MASDKLLVAGESQQYDMSNVKGVIMYITNLKNENKKPDKMLLYSCDSVIKST